MNPNDNNIDDSGEDDMDAPDMENSMHPASMPPSGMPAKSSDDNLDYGHPDSANKTLQLLGAGQPYMNKNK